MPVEIEGECTSPVYKGVGVYYLPGIIIKAEWPQCGRWVARDLEERGVSIVTKLTIFTCGQCGDPWPVRFEVDVTIREADDGTQPES